MGRRVTIGWFLILLVVRVSIAQSKPINTITSSEISNTIILPIQDNSSLIKSELTSQIDGRPVHFAKGIKVNITPETHGKWESRGKNELRWELIIKSPDAFSLNLGFNNFMLPEGSQLFLSDATGNDTKGPFTESDNKEHKEFWTPLIRGDEIHIVLVLPKDKREELIMNLTKVSHDYLDFASKISGSCNLDVICGEDDGYELVEQYRDIIRSVGAYHINGEATCTGSLVNNTLKDKKPYFLTADHCGVTSSTDASLVVYWNYQSSYCRELGSSINSEDGDGRFDQFTIGSILRASWEDSDFALLELESPVQEQFDPFYAGWNAEGAYPASAICIHHPAGEEKRISFEFDPLTSNNTVNFIYVNDWDIGTTEGGSSGAPLFNPSSQIIGQLKGGLASCSNDSYDRFGRFARSWVGNSFPSGSLKPWLDPENTGVLSIDGFEGDFFPSVEFSVLNICNETDQLLTIDVTTSNAYANFITIEVDNVPIGVTVSQISENITPGDKGMFILEIPSDIPFGSYPIEITTTDGINEGSVGITLNIYNEVPTSVALAFPTDEFINASTSQLLEWNEVDQAQDYQLELSEKDNFSTLVLQEQFNSETNTVTSGLMELTQYFWRVRSTNSCGEGDWSEIFSFTTAPLFCKTYKSEHGPIEIPEAGFNTIISEIFIENSLTLNDINVLNVDVEHSYISDLDIVLLSPDNERTSVLIQTPCGDDQNIFMGFDDQSSELVYPCPPINGEAYRPITPLSNLLNTDSEGAWSLQVSDTYNLDGGQFNSWEVEFCFTGVTEAVAINLEPGKSICVGQEASIRIYYDTKGSAMNAASLENIQGEIINFDDSFLPLNGSGVIDLVLTEPTELVMGFQDIYFKLGSLDEILLEIEQIESSEITSFSPDIEGLTTDRIGNFNWTASNSTGFIAEIARDPDFEDIEWQQEFGASVSSFNGPLIPNGTYYLRMSSLNACSQFYTPTYNFIIEGSVNTYETILNHIEIFPNPVDDLLIIDGNIDYQNVEVGIFDITGKQMKQFVFRSETHQTDVSQLKPGVYLIEIALEDERKAEKLIIF